MDLAGRHTSQFDHPALSHTSQLFRLHFYANGFLLRKKKKTLPSFHPVVMCADAWDSGDLSAVTYGIAGEMERAACLPIPHLLVGEAPSDLNH